MSALAKVELNPGLARHLRNGHPWVFKRALSKVPRLPAGAVVDVVEDRRFVARGYFDPFAAISVRVLTLDPHETIDAEFFARRIQRAATARTDLLDLEKTNAYRLIHGEGDTLPGVVVDLYANFAVLKLYSAGLVPFRPLIVEALQAAVPNLRGVLGRDEVGKDDGEGDEGHGTGKVLWGETPPERIEILEHGARFLVDVWTGQKTGFFVDQRDNRLLLRRLSKGRDVLNCFCFSGGFSVNAALGGARRVFSVDSDEDAIELAQENFEANGLSPEAHDFLAADVFKLLASFKTEGRTFDLIVLDPPAFAKSQKAVEAAIDGYASLNRQALALLRPGGYLATASCSARVTPEQFLGAVGQGAANAGVDLTLVHERYQPPDHPIRLAFPEGRYLKFFVLQAR